MINDTFVYAVTILYFWMLFGHLSETLSCDIRRLFKTSPVFGKSLGSYCQLGSRALLGSGSATLVSLLVQFDQAVLDGSFSQRMGNAVVIDWSAYSCQGSLGNQSSAIS